MGFGPSYEYSAPQYVLVHNMMIKTFDWLRLENPSSPISYLFEKYIEHPCIMGDLRPYTYVHTMNKSCPRDSPRLSNEPDLGWAHMDPVWVWKGFWGLNASSNFDNEPRTLIWASWIRDKKDLSQPRKKLSPIEALIGNELSIQWSWLGPLDNRNLELIAFGWVLARTAK